MSQVNHQEAFKVAVDLLKHQDDNVQSWSGRFVATQSGLAVAEAALLAWKGQTSGWLITVLAVLVGALALILTVAIAGIILRHREWAEFYVQAVIRAEDQAPFLLYQPGHRIPGTNLATIVERVRTSFVLAWSLFILALLVERVFREPCVRTCICRVWWGEV